MPYFPSGGLGLPIDLTGATSATRYVGGTATGAPLTGTFAAGDYVITQDGTVQVCTVAGTPGTWVAVGGAGSGLPAGGTVGQVVVNTGSGTGSWQGPANETMAGSLVNATSTGDAGNRADHFLGSALGGAWTQEASAATVTVANSSWVVATIGGAESVYTKPYTPSGAFRVEAKVLLSADNNQVILAVKDSSSGTDASGNWIELAVLTNDTVVTSKIVAGSGTVINTVADDRLMGRWIYLAISRDGSNNWSTYYSFDRAAWITAMGGSAFAFTFTVAKFGRRDVGGSLQACFDFIDVVS